MEFLCDFIMVQVSPPNSCSSLPPHLYLTTYDKPRCWPVSFPTLLPRLYGLLVEKLIITQEQVVTQDTAKMMIKMIFSERRRMRKRAKKGTGFCSIIEICDY